jgi:hypothetical protein
MSKVGKEERVKLEEIMKNSKDVFLPYELADKIIKEVLANGENSREKIMRMILEHNVKTIKETDRGRKDIAELIKKSDT